jgi:hypothetical protein
MSDEHEHKVHQDIFFFYIETKIEVDKSPMTGSEIKAAILLRVPSFDTSHELVEEGHGSEKDKLITDTDTVSLTHGHGEEPKHFYSRPPTNFGSQGYVVASSISPV